MWMAEIGTVTITEQTHKMIKKVTFDWTATTGEAGDTTIKYYDGEVLRINCRETSCTGYALELNDSDGVDLLGGQGAALTSGGTDFGTSTGGSITYPLSAVSSKLTLAITGCSTGSTGEVIIYIR